MSAHFFFKSFVIFTVVAAPTLFLRATDRTTISLNGTWQIEDSKEAEAIPVAWNHNVPDAWAGTFSRTGASAGGSVR